MNRKTFIERRRQYVRSSWYYWGGLVGFLAIYSVVIRFVPKAWGDTALGVFFLTMFAIILLAFLRDRWYVKTFGLACKSCGRWLLSPVAAGPAISTGKCGRCGGHAFDP